MHTITKEKTIIESTCCIETIHCKASWKCFLLNEQTLRILHPTWRRQIFVGWRILHLLALLVVNGHQEARGCQWVTLQARGCPGTEPCTLLLVLSDHCAASSKAVVLSQLKYLCPLHTEFSTAGSTELAQQEHSPGQHNNTNVAQVLQIRCWTTNSQKRLKFRFLHLSRYLLSLHK